VNDSLLGRVLLGRYRVVARLARGGMGVVYLARTEGAAGFVKPVVIKRVLPESEEADLVAMFVREARILSNLRHPNIAGIVDFAEEGGAHLMVLEYVHGYDLHHWRRYVRGVRGNFDFSLAIHIVLMLLDALAHAHTIERPDGTTLEIVHRDISPSNVIIDTEGHVKLVDFGVARMSGAEAGLYKTAASMVKGKIPYVPPEQLSGTPPSPGTDVYACAVLLHDLLVGKNEFRGADMAETVKRVLTHVPPRISTVRSDLPKELDHILMRELSKNPSVRYQSAGELASALREIQSLGVHEARAKLAAQVRIDFVAMPGALDLEPLEARERAWRTTSEELDRLEDVSTSPDAEVNAADSGRPTAFAKPAPPPPIRAARRPLWPWIAGVVLALGTLAGALALTISILGAPSRPPEQVFIVQEDEPAPPRSIEVAPEDEPPVPPPEEIETPLERAEDPAPRRPRSSQGELTSAFARRGPDVERCVRTHAAGIEGAPQISVRFVIGRDGRTRNAIVSPPSIAPTPLGTCLRGVAMSVEFPPQTRDGISFVIPIRIEQR
jgi:serine/threonine protein kinase